MNGHPHEHVPGDGCTVETAPVIVPQRYRDVYVWNCPFCGLEHRARFAGLRVKGCPCGKRVMLDVGDRLINREQAFRAVFASTGGRCWYCGGRLFVNWTMDHIVSRKRGGKDRAENLRPACIGCNTTKRHLSIEEFRAICSHNWQRSHRICGLPEPAGGFQFWGEQELGR